MIPLKGLSSQFEEIRFFFHHGKVKKSNIYPERSGSQEKAFWRLSVAKAKLFGSFPHIGLENLHKGAHIIIARLTADGLDFIVCLNKELSGFG